MNGKAMMQAQYEADALNEKKDFPKGKKKKKRTWGKMVKGALGS